MKKEYIIIRKAREHNLKEINLKIPRNQFVVITGLSGSGKSSLAFDTIYAEGQRRYVESLSAYARQFLEQLKKPDVEHIEGLSPTISIEQKTTSRNPRSTVATQTEINDYLRLFFARVGTPYCSKCGKKIERQTIEEIIQSIILNMTDSKIIILAPFIRGRKGEYRQIGQKVARAGFSRLRIDGQIFHVEDDILLDRYKVHNIEVVVDRLTLKEKILGRLTDSLETALELGKGIVIISDVNDSNHETMYSENYACIDCGLNIPEIEPRNFSFNSPYGACVECNGLGTKMEIDPDLLVPDDKKVWINAIAPARRGRRAFLMYFRSVMREFAKLYDFDLTIPFNKLGKSFRQKMFYGSDTDMIWGKCYEGVIPYLERLFRETDNDWLKDEISNYMSELPCPNCKGTRLKSESLSVKVDGRNIAEVNRFSIKQARLFFEKLRLNPSMRIISEPIVKEIIRRLDFCIDVGLEYLTLDRKSSTLSGGEAERIRLATQIGSGLVGVVYILDEPSIGLHPKDNERLLRTLHALRDLGNTLIVVEHDEETIRQSDYIIDLGPGAGEHGGEVLHAGSVASLLRSRKSLTGQYLRGKLMIPVPRQRRSQTDKCIIIYGAAENNLKKITVKIPLQNFVCVTGVSGSGKSTLVDEILYKALAQKIYKSKLRPGVHRKIDGIEHIDKIIEVDQSPIGRTPRSNPATYTGVFSHIRDVFSRLPESKMRGFKPGRFSFNVKGGRCEVCRGDGIRKIEMHFLPDVYVECEVCKGQRFTGQTLEITYKGYNIAQILSISVLEALHVFDNIPRIKRVLTTLNDVGLGYIRLGQPATTLSGGEAQRVKLAGELCKPSTGRTLYVLDEPTTGLHFADVHKLLNVLQCLVDKDNTVLVIEHNLEVIKNADYVIDLGPEGGDLGGEIVYAGTPEDLMKQKKSYTGQYLKSFLCKFS